nr:MAG TPA: hypothetical protein [Caudoviricetes sp.]
MVFLFFGTILFSQPQISYVTSVSTISGYLPI